MDLKNFLDTPETKTSSTDTQNQRSFQRTPQCSAKKCNHEADWQLLWNNPKIHDPERRKIWLACDSHREYLEEFLSLRNFLIKTIPLPSNASEDSKESHP